MINDFIKFQESAPHTEHHESWYFPEIISPFIDFVIANAECNSQINITKELRSACRDCIYRDLSQYLVEPLYNLFAIFRSSKLSGLSMLLMREAQPSSCHLYEQFCSDILADFRAFLDSAPYLTYVLFEQITQQIEIWTNFFLRCSIDSKSYSFIPHIDNIVEISNGKDDPHDSGRTVLFIKDNTGRVCIYKSRCMEAENFLYNILGCFSKQTGYKFELPEIITFKEYGWMEYILCREVKSPESASLYFERTGSLLFLLYIINACDMHEENIIAHGSNPVIIDAETIFHPQISSLELDQIKLNEVGILPDNINSVVEGYSLNFHSDMKRILGKEILWKNSDVMKMVESKHWVSRTNVLKISGDIASPEDYVDSILEGFTKSYEVLLEPERNNEMLCLIRQKGNGIKVRAIVRTSEYYSKVLSILKGKALSSVEDVATYLRDMLCDGEYLELEIEALLKGFIPVFTTSSSVNDLSGTLERDGLSICLEKLGALSYTGMSQQTEEIRILIENQHNKSKHSYAASCSGV